MTEGDKLTHATQAFVRMLRREFDKRRPEGPNPVPPWEDMRPRDKASWLRCVQAALEAHKTAANSEA